MADGAIQNPKSQIQNFRRCRPVGQSAVEYVVVLAAVAAALLSMAVYMKRGVSGSLRGSADSVGEPYHPKNSSTGPGGLIQTFSGDTVTQSILIPDVPMCRDSQTGDMAVCQDPQADPALIVDSMQTTTSSFDTSGRTGSEYVGALTGDLWD
jgi:hypothetical protein